MSQIRLNPLMAGAAGAVIVTCGVAVAAMTGWLPAASSKPEAVSAVPAAEPARPAPKSETSPARRTTASVACAKCGVITSVHAEEVKGDASGVGAVAGGVAGAVVGNQFGRGDGRTIMTIAGAAGGAYAGNEIEKHVKKQTVYRVTVRLDDGKTVSLTQPGRPAFAVGERVRVNGSALERA